VAEPSVYDRQQHGGLAGPGDDQTHIEKRADLRARSRAYLPEAVELWFVADSCLVSLLP
jgi:hypothetical protein